MNKKKMLADMIICALLIDQKCFFQYHTIYKRCTTYNLLTAVSLSVSSFLFWAEISNYSTFQIFCRDISCYISVVFKVLKLKLDTRNLLKKCMLNILWQQPKNCLFLLYNIPDVTIEYSIKTKLNQTSFFWLTHA